MTPNGALSDAFILFTVAGTAYAVRSRDVQHIDMIEQVTRVPNAPPFVDGVVFSRGQVVPAVNLRARFGFERAAYDVRTRLLVVQTDGRSLGLVVDDGREFIRIPETAIQPPQEAFAALSGEYVEGVASLNGRLIVVLDLDRLLKLTDPQIPA